METKYNYFEAVVKDIETYIAENEIRVVGPGAMSRDDLYDELLNSDYVTGNLSGSYTFSRCYLLDSCLDAVLDGIKEDVSEYYESHNMEE